ncbi:hypothetical protein J1N35_013128 [Gossypium stocksii]|uniref:Leucine-rich repeat-containing N-terminal plant-type domain-containing protein n=1 Tax=Gossypium stocksii TaxID=47602 RepID=A0A9D3VS62_9ROSI|nr:hypothetical protein J1N35_013128 [Gossypium stocksii]
MKVSLTLLRLSNNNLSGNVVPVILNANGVQKLYLDGNNFLGEMTNVDVSNFEFPNSLSEIDLSNNKLHGKLPRWIGNASFLRRLALSNNGFKAQLCKLNSLSIIDLSQNMFSSRIPSCLGNLSLLMQMKKILENNEFYSPYIEEDESTLIMIGNLEMDSYSVSYLEEVIEFTTKSGFYSYKGSILLYMTGIDLSCKNLTGHILQELGNLSEIYSLNLSHNKLIGVIPSSFSKLQHIESLDLSYNNLSGEISNQLVELNSLEVFSVAYNNLSGSIPKPKSQFWTFIENNYERNLFLCGVILHKSCSKTDSPSTISTILEDKGEDGLIDTYDFCVSFLVSYVVVLLTIFVVLYINPYWRRAWFSLVGKCITTCRYSNVGNFLSYYIFKQCV